MALVAQDATLFNATLAENIAYGVDGSFKMEDVVEAAKAAQAHDFISAFPEGYQTKVGDFGARISGGQKQRIAIARAIMRKAKILLLDEATSALDSESEAQVQNAIDALIRMHKCTVVLVAHRLSTVMNADIIAVIADGKVIEQGNHDELIRKQGTYFKLVERQTVRRKRQQEDSTATDQKASSDDRKLLGDVDIIDKLTDS
jgi:ATP-binding cassette subfamily B (MDR/TAP) protein 1